MKVPDSESTKRILEQSNRMMAEKNKRERKQWWKNQWIVLLGLAATLVGAIASVVAAVFAVLTYLNQQ